MKNNYKAGRSISRDYSNVTIPCDNTMEIEYSSGATRLKLVSIQNDIIEQMESEKNCHIDKTTTEEVLKAISKLNTGKAPGSDGLSVEHFRNAPDEFIPTLVDVINQIFLEKEVPKIVKERIITPVHKTGKDKYLPGNYRGITVTNVISSIIERIIKDRIEPDLAKSQSKLERGFTEKTSSLNAVFIISETIEYSKEKSQELFLVTLDAQKAFDRVHHEILFNKIYHDGIQGDLWLLIQNMYREVTVKVKWNNSLSEQFTQELGG